MLVKLTTAINFTNILLAILAPISLYQKITSPSIKVAKNTFVIKAACIMFVKLTFEVNFMNMLTCSFYICTCTHALAPDFYFTNNTSPNYVDQYIQLEVTYDQHFYALCSTPVVLNVKARRANND
jgi:hypothetical protein